MPAARLNRERSWRLGVAALCAAAALLAGGGRVLAGDGTNEIPHGQSRPPGPALTPAQAIDHMQLPAGFKVDLVASEPEVINPTAFTFDDQGRIWLTESVEYPRASAGPGQDRVKILESTHHDGHFDKMTVFKDGLNIPSGIAIGNGGVYVANSPDILFLQDTHGAGHADKAQVILTGFGRDDRHELPNSLTWGPDGWLYGMNGVFNHSHVVSPGDGKVYDFTCAIWRYQPATKKFELFAQGTSNPWGLDYNRQGDWFVSCCVIDHLFHMTQSGYYQRQGGPYPPLTHWLPSITTQRHQQAAYGGLCIYDATVYPDAYRGTLFMGNLHGSRINRDTLTRNGATYTQHNADDFLLGNDAWYMPVSEKVGPDGCIYVMDWYDKYHCYQDANRDSPGLDRTRGRIYRISYDNAPAYGAFDLQKATSTELLAQLDDPNVWRRRTAQRILSERFDAQKSDLVPALERMAMAPDHNNAHMHALWLLVSHDALDEPIWLKALSSADEPTRNWGVRAAGQAGDAPPAVYARLLELTADPSPDVRAQLAVAAGRLPEPRRLEILEKLLLNLDNANDPLIPTLIYNNLLPTILGSPGRGKELLAFLESNPAVEKAYAKTTAPWLRLAINSGGREPREVVADLTRHLGPDSAPALRSIYDALSQAGLDPRERSRLFSGKTRQAIEALATGDSPARGPAILVALWWNDSAAAAAARKVIADPHAEPAERSEMVKALADARDPENVKAFAALSADEGAPILVRQNALDALGSMNDRRAADVLAGQYNALSADLKPMALNAMTHSVAAASALLDAVKSKSIPADAVTVNQVRQILGLNNKALSDKTTAVWGKVRTERDPERVKVVERMRKAVADNPPGDPRRGLAVFNKVCAQCHSIYGSHQGTIGPDLTGVGRENLDAVLTNVLDPSLVIGAPYLVYVVKTKGGDSYSGLLVERSDKRIVLKDPTKQMVIPADDVAKVTVQNISMMPEGLEKTMTQKDFIDLVAFMLTREPPK